jgi:uroporphyrinogen-III synthase
MEQSHALSRKLREFGATVIEIPAIRIVELNDAPLRSAIVRIDRYSLVIFTSASAVHIFCRCLAQLPDHAAAFSAIPIAVIGAATARTLEEYGFKAAIVPDEFVADGLVAALVQSGIPLSGQSILIPRAKTARAVLTRELNELGAVIDDIPIYDTIPEPFARDKSLLNRLIPTPDILTFTSSSTVTFFRDGLPAGLLEELQLHSVAACIGPIAAETARSAGFTVDIIPEYYSIDGLVEAIVDYYRAGE